MTLNGLKWFVIGFLTVVLVSCGMDACRAETEDKDKRHAPVVTQAVNGVMLQVGWQQYQKMEGAVVLYCIKTKDKVLLDCVVYVQAESGAGITLIENIVPTEEQT